MRTARASRAIIRPLLLFFFSISAHLLKKTDVTQLGLGVVSMPMMMTTVNPDDGQGELGGAKPQELDGAGEEPARLAGVGGGQLEAGDAVGEQIAQAGGQEDGALAVYFSFLQSI